MDRVRIDPAECGHTETDRLLEKFLEVEELRCADCCRPGQRVYETRDEEFGKPKMYLVSLTPREKQMIVNVLRKENGACR